jgi:hypothetical protein
MSVERCAWMYQDKTTGQSQVVALVFSDLPRWSACTANPGYCIWGKPSRLRRGKARVYPCRDVSPPSLSQASLLCCFIRLSAFSLVWYSPLEPSNCDEAAYAPKSPSVWLFIVALPRHRALLFEVPLPRHQTTPPRPRRIFTQPNLTIRTLSCIPVSPCC